MADKQTLEDLKAQFEAQGLPEKEAIDKALMAYSTSGGAAAPTLPGVPAEPKPIPMRSVYRGDASSPYPTTKPVTPVPTAPAAPTTTPGMKDFITSGKMMGGETKPKETPVPDFLKKPLDVKDRVSSRAELKQAARVSAANPKVAKVTIDYMTQQMEELPADEREKFNDKIEDLKQLYADAQTRTQWSEVGEKFGNALAGLGAAMYGAKHGFDMSGTKFDKTDWDKKYDRQLKELELGVSDVQRQRTENLDQVEKAKTRNFQRSAQNLEAQNQASAEGAKLTTSKENQALGEAHQDARTNAQLQTQWQIAQLDAGVKELTAKKALNKEQTASFNKARVALSEASRATKDEAKQGALEKARGFLNDAGMDPDAVDSIFTEPGVFWGRNDSAPVDVAKALNFTQSYGVTPDAFQKFYQQSKAQGYKGSESDAMRQLLDRIKQQELSKANG